MKVLVAAWIELETPEGIVALAKRLREAGVVRMRAFTPYAVPELEDALGLGRPRLLQGSVLVAGLAGLALAFAVISWTAFDSGVDAGGRPLLSFPTSIPIMFETGILFAAVTAFAGCLVACGMPRLDEPVLVAGFGRTTTNRFWLGVDTLDPAWRPELLDAAAELGASAIHRVTEEDEP